MPIAYIGLGDCSRLGNLVEQAEQLELYFRMEFLLGEFLTLVTLQVVVDEVVVIYLGILELIVHVDVLPVCYTQIMWWMLTSYFSTVLESFVIELAGVPTKIREFCSS